MTRQDPSSIEQVFLPELGGYINVNSIKANQPELNGYYIYSQCKKYMEIGRI